MSTQTQPITFADLVELEPQLGRLLAEAQSWRHRKRPRDFCANLLWVRTFKPRLLRLVGWHADRRGVLATSEAYDVAYDIIYDALPSCRRCACL